MELLRHINRFQGVSWNWNSLSLHPSVTLGVLKKLPDKPWNWYLLTNNPKFVWLWVQEFPNKDWDWTCLSRKDSFVWNWVREMPNAQWNWNVLSDKVSNVEIVKEFPDAPWNWYKLTLGSISASEMVANPNLPWTINELLFVDIDEEIVTFLRFFRSHYDQEAWNDHTSRVPWKIWIRNKDLPWNLFFLRINSSSEFVYDRDIHVLYENKAVLNWGHFSEFLDFSSVIAKCPDLPWVFAHVSRNKTVTYRDVMAFPTLKWDHSVMHLECDRTEWNAANTIKKFWKKCVTDPQYAMCRRALLNHLMGISIGGNDICEN